MNSALMIEVRVKRAILLQERAIYSARVISAGMSARLLIFGIDSDRQDS